MTSECRRQPSEQDENNQCDSPGSEEKKNYSTDYEIQTTRTLKRQFASPSDRTVSMPNTVSPVDQETLRQKQTQSYPMSPSAVSCDIINRKKDLLAELELEKLKRRHADEKIAEIERQLARLQDEEGEREGCESGFSSRESLASNFCDSSVSDDVKSRRNCRYLSVQSVYDNDRLNNRSIDNEQNTPNQSE